MYKINDWLNLRCRKDETHLTFSVTPAKALIRIIRIKQQLTKLLTSLEFSFTWYNIFKGNFSWMGLFSLTALKRIMPFKDERIYINTLLWANLSDVERYTSTLIFLGNLNEPIRLTRNTRHHPTLSSCGREIWSSTDSKWRGHFVDQIFLFRVDFSHCFIWSYAENAHYL